jgi:hypothetical protein
MPRWVAATSVIASIRLCASSHPYVRCHVGGLDCQQEQPVGAGEPTAGQQDSDQQAHVG